MPQSTGVHSYSTQLLVNDNGDGNTFVAISECYEIRGPEEEIGTVKLTNLSSPNATSEFAPGMINPGRVTFSVTFTKAQLTKLISYRRVVKLWQILFPLLASESNASKWQGSAFITKRGLTVPDPDGNDRISSDIEMQCTGQWTFTQGS